MNYELAKKLKESGFSSESMFAFNVPGGNYEILPNPSLEELIDACGDNFIALVKQLDHEVLPWRCDTNENRTYGHTQIEAVVNLYIALNKKQ